MKLDNFLPLSRKLQTHWIFKDSSYLHCWLEMLFNARFSNEPKTEIYKGVLYTINRGEFIYSRPTYSARLGVSEGKLRTLLKLLISDGMIEEVNSLGSNKPTIYKIINYNSYNIQPSEYIEIKGFEVDYNQVTTKSQPSGNQVTTKSQPLKNKDNIENKEIKKEEDIKDKDIIVVQSPTRESIPYQSIVDMFHMFCETLPRVQVISDTRKKNIKARWSDSKSDLATFELIFKNVHESDFLSGRNGKWTACNFDWIMKQANFIKIGEGNYENKCGTGNVFADAVKKMGTNEEGGFKW